MFEKNSVTLLTLNEKMSKPLRDVPVVISEWCGSVFDASLLLNLTQAINETTRLIRWTSAVSGYEDNAEPVENSRKNIDEVIVARLINSPSVTKKIVMKLLPQEIKKQEAGNCLEYSVYCHHLLNAKGIDSEIFKIGGGDHIFLVVDRDQSVESSEFLRFGDKAIIVDPYFGLVYAPREIPEKLKTAVYNQDTHRISYHAFDAKKHMLVNDVVSDLVSDYNTRVMLARLPKEPESGSNYPGLKK